MENGYECGLPVAFYRDDAFYRKTAKSGPDIYQKLCAICAANAVSDGETVRRIEPMKLLFCKSCTDIVAIHSDVRRCICGKSKSRYLNGINAINSGPSLILGVENKDLANLVIENFDSRGFYKGEWRVLSGWAGTVTKVKNVDTYKPPKPKRRLDKPGQGVLSSRRRSRQHPNI